jgi:hypothetical protein
MSKSVSLMLVFLVAVGSLLIGIFPAVATSAGEEISHEVVFTIPVGQDGIEYEGEHPEMLPWGPTAFTVSPDGSFWIADAAGNRLLHYSPAGSSLGMVNLAGQVVGIGDLAVTRSEVWVLDIASVIPQVLRLSPEGKLLERYEIPEGLRLEDGLSGIAVGDQGEVLIEREGGASVSRFLDAGGRVDILPLPGYTHRGQLYAARPANLASGDAGRGFITVGEVQIEITTTHSLGGLHLLGFHPDGSFYVVVEEVAVQGAIQVDQVVRRYGIAGDLLGLARIPLAEQHTYVAHNLAVGPDGAVYALITRPERVEVWRLRFCHALAPVLPPVPAGASGSDGDVRGAVLACVPRSSMMSTASGYRNNSKYLSATNTDGACSGRSKPRYIGGAGVYPSVAYDWGGWDTVSGYNGYMYPNTYQAGDINTSMESCSRGTDCSGFVSRVWQLPYKYSTRTLPNVSWQLPSVSYLQPGDIMNKVDSHVVLFSGFGANGIYDYESTTYNAYDRVVYIYSSWSRLSGYVPRRYNNVCP